MTLELQPGDLFAVADPTILGRLIRGAEKNILGTPGLYDHAGFITDPAGTTLESAWKYGYGKLSDYEGCQILIVRDIRMTPERYAQGFSAVYLDIGETYPWWRLPLFALKLDRLFPFGIGVCSEQTGKFMKGAGFQKIVYGVSPDDLALHWRKHFDGGHMIPLLDGRF